MLTCFGHCGQSSGHKSTKGRLYIVYKHRYQYMVWNSNEILLLYNIFILNQSLAFKYLTPYTQFCVLCITGMLEYMLQMSREAKVVVGVMGVCCILRFSQVVVLMLKEYGSGVICLILEVKRQTKQILDNMLTSNRTNAQTKSELLNWYDVITKQNYFQHNGKTITQTDGLAMGAPSSGIISEIFLQHIEPTHLPPPNAETQTRELLPIRR